MSIRPIQNSVQRPLAAGPEILLGELSGLFRQLGSADAAAQTGPANALAHPPQIDTVSALKTFLENYQTRILLPLELPAIARACAHAARGETKELISFDQQLAAQPAWTAFANASQRVGRLQLQRLRPLRDQRVVQRYLAAVEANQAQAWHTIVYGLTLAIYSLPLRQGLLNYAEQTLSGFAETAARAHHFPEAACREILEKLFTKLPEAIETVLAGSEPWQLAVP